LSVTLAAGQSTPNVNFGYVTGSISGFTYVDANKNGVRDSGEAGIGGVVVTLSGAASGTATTAADGSYTFSGLKSGSYSVAAPSTAAGLARSTASPLNVTLAAGQAVPNVNFGYVGATITGTVFVDDNLNGTQDIGENYPSGVTVTLTGPVSTTTTTSTTGTYTFTNLPSGTYTVTVGLPTSGYTTTTVVVTAGGTVTATKLAFKPAFVTYTTGGWGAPPNGSNAGSLLAANFSTLYGSGVTIGGSPYYAKFTSASAIEAYLPDGGTASKLTKNYTNPTTTTAGKFLGSVLALRLAVDFSNARITPYGFGSLKVAAGNPLAGYTIAQVLSIANSVVAGNMSALPAGMTIPQLDSLVTSLNMNFDNGTIDNGVCVK
jgi:hypothetical protein